MYKTQNGVTYGFYTDEKFDLAEQRPVRRLVQLLPGQGCVPWLKTKSACCPFCRLPAGTRLAVLGEGHETHFEPWQVCESDYFEMIDASFAAAEHVDTVVCFNGGSFLTDLEIPASVRRHLYGRVAQHPTAKNLMIESRPEFVRQDILREAKTHLQGKALTVAIGLESTNDKVRNGPLAKFIGRKSFDKALSLLKAERHRVSVYVFLGAPGLSEAEAYLDAQTSVRELHALGVDEIALSCAFVAPGGKLEQAFRAGSFRPPRLWSIAQLIAQAKRNGWPLSLGKFDDFPPPVAIPANCGYCDEGIHALFDLFRQTNRFEMSDLPDCACRAQ